jgi:hypothetical protein
MSKIPIGSTHWFIIINLLLLAIAPSSIVGAVAVSHGNSQRASSAMPSIVQTSSSPGLNLTLDTSSVTIGLGEDAIIGLTITGTNGFNDTVALSSSIAPNSPGTTGDGFSGSFSKDVFRISPGNPTFRVNVTVKAYTLPPYLPAYPPLGSYTMTVFATGQTPPLYVASTQMQVNVQPYAPPNPKLLFELGYKGPASPSATIQLDSNFTDIGNVELVVTGLGFSGDFGSFNEPVGLPLSIYPSEKKSLSLNLTISSGMSLGSHRISSMSTWDYYVPNHYDANGNNFYAGGWTTGNAIVVNGSIAVVSNIPSPFGLLASALNLAFRNPAVIVGLTIYAILVTLASILIIRNDLRKGRELAKMHKVFH